jgi:hypothetical protein
MYQAMLKRNRKNKIEKKQKFIEKLKDIEEENKKENRFAGDINRSSVASDDSYLRVTSFYESIRNNSFGTNESFDDELEEDKLDLDKLTFFEKTALFGNSSFILVIIIAGDIL